MTMPPPEPKIISVAPTDQALIGALCDADLPVEDLEASKASFYGIQAAGTLAGFGGIQVLGRNCLLRSLVILPSHQRRGLGQMLVAKLLETAARQNLDAAYLLTATAPDFFASLGFKPVARTNVAAEIQRSAEFSNLCPGNAVVMILALHDRATG
ncbi:MAG: arsenic resistance N-acetyltransferase ArsN2 [Alphaproteobacteria bacterium]